MKEAGERMICALCMGTRATMHHVTIEYDKVLPGSLTSDSKISVEQRSEFLFEPRNPLVAGGQQRLY